MRDQNRPMYAPVNLRLNQADARRVRYVLEAWQGGVKDLVHNERTEAAIADVIEVLASQDVKEW